MGNPKQLHRLAARLLYDALCGRAAKSCSTCGWEDDGFTTDGWSHANRDCPECGGKYHARTIGTLELLFDFAE
jgi:hypothetical protein